MKIAEFLALSDGDLTVLETLIALARALQAQGKRITTRRLLIAYREVHS